MFLSILALFTLVRLVATNTPDGPIVLPFNATHVFGADGPWQALPVQISWPIQQLVNLYPGGTSSSVLISNNVATGRDLLSFQDFTSIVGVYNASLPKPAIEGSSENFAFAEPDSGGWLKTIDGGWAGREPSRLEGLGLTITDTVFHENFGGRVKNASLLAAYDAKYHLPDGRKIPLDVGFLSLGAQDHEFVGEYIGRMIPLDLASNGPSYSNSCGLHIGSVDHKIPGSLVLGGYDKARVVGDVNTANSQDGNGNMFINLLDISLGVARGGSPFPFKEKTWLLRYTQNDTQAVQDDRWIPTGHLSTIVGPIYVEHRLSSIQDDSVVTGIFSLRFSTRASLGNLTIRVPLALLNLTLTPPLVNTSIPYFTCKSFAPPESTNRSRQPHYHLGRAFLQAAFIGMNWHNSKWWMAQAPGPQAIPSSVTPLNQSSETIAAIAGQFLWASSWDGFWTPLPEGLNRNSDGPYLSRGAKAGIAVGALAGAAVALGAAFLLLRRRRRNLNRAASSNPSQNPLTGGPYTTQKDDLHASQLMFKPELPVPSADDRPASGNGDSNPSVQPDTVHELPAAQGEVSHPLPHELPHELPAENSRVSIITNARTNGGTNARTKTM